MKYRGAVKNTSGAAHWVRCRVRCAIRRINSTDKRNFSLWQGCRKSSVQNKLVFDDEKIRIEVFYKEELLAFRSCDEGNRWKTVDSVLGMKGKEFFKNKLFFKVENSNSKKWYSQETFNTSKENEFEHYATV